VFFLGEARPVGVAAVADATEGVFDGQCVEGSRIVVVRPFLEVGMARMSRISNPFERLVEARNAAAVVGRSVPFTTDEARIGDAWLAGADIAHCEPMLPAVAEIVRLIDDGLSRLEHIAQTHLGRHHGRLGSPVVIHRQIVPLPADCELTEVVIEPAAHPSRPTQGRADMIISAPRTRLPVSGGSGIAHDQTVGICCGAWKRSGMAACGAGAAAGAGGNRVPQHPIR